MILNTAEQEIWKEHQAFFAPNETPNDLAYSAYLNKYAQLTDYESRSGLAQQQLVGLLLKQAPDEAVINALPQYYKQFRTGANSVEFDAWLGEFSARRAELVAQCFKQVAPELNFTQQVMILRDVQKWLPGSNIKDYAPPKLLKTKPSVILKQFNPTLPDMPYLLAMSGSLMREKDPQSQALGDTIVRGCFIARYGMLPESDEGRYPNSWQRPTVKYCTTEAFAMLLRHDVNMAPASLLQQVQLRYNAQSVMFDALAYPVMVFDNPHAASEATDYATAVLDEVLSFAEREPSHDGFGAIAEQALACIYGSLASRDATMSKRIEDVLEIHIRLAKFERYSTNRTYDNVLADVARSLGRGPDLLRPLAKKVLDAAPERLAFLQRVTLDVGADIYNTMSCAPPVCNAFFALLKPEEIEPYLVGSMCTFFDIKNDANSRTQKLKKAFQNLANYEWSAEQKNVFKKSPVAATTILLYLYMTASGHAKNPESTYEQGVPFTQWEPLPFLKKIYPENMPLWNQMTVGLLQMPMSNSGDDFRHQYQRVMGSMFQAFSQAFLAEGPSLAIAQGIIESLDANPLDYFLNANKKAAPVMSLELPEDMFTFS